MGRKLIWTLGLVSATAAVYFWRQRAANAADRADRAVDEASEESFPASDAPAHTPTLGSLTRG